MDSFPRAGSAIVGAATYGIGVNPGYKPTDLAARAAVLALEDAGLPLSRVDGLFVCLPDDALAGLAVAEYLGIRPKFTDCNRTGGSAFLSHAITASFMLQAGYIDNALIMYGSNQRSAGGKLVQMRQSSPYEDPYRPMNPLSSYALATARHMHQYGTTRRQLAEVAVAARQWANLNPEAFMQGPLTIDDCLNARQVSDPLGVRDCCLITDGAAAVVMTRADRVGEFRPKPIYVLGAGVEVTHASIDQMPDVTVTGAREAAKRAFEVAGVGPADIDLVELYDAFSINTLMILEDMGFCKKGEGGDFVSDGRIAPGGVLPVNTNGGGLSCCHPGMYGLFTMIEATRQLRGEAGERQVADANLAVAHGNGGALSSQAVLVLGSQATL